MQHMMRWVVTNLLPMMRRLLRNYFHRIFIGLALDTFRWIFMGFSFCYFRDILNRFSWDFHRYRIGLSLDGFRLILKRIFIGFLVDFRWTMFGRFRICLHRIFMGFSLGFSLHPAAGRGYLGILEGLGFVSVSTLLKVGCLGGFRTATVPRFARESSTPAGWKPAPRKSA